MPDNDDGRDDFVLITPSGDDGDAADRTLKRMIVAAMSGATMRIYGAAVALLLTGRRGSDLRAPEPIVQVGPEPNEDEMRLIVAMAEEQRRDLIHVGCHADGSGKPTGMIAIVHFEGGKAISHRRGGLIRGAGDQDVILVGFGDVEHEPYHFVLPRGGKMKRVEGYPLDDLGADMQRGGERWFECAGSLDAADCADEILRVPGVLQGPGGPG